MKSVSTRLLLIVIVILIVGVGLSSVIGTVLAGTALHEESLGRIGEATERNANVIDTWVVTNTHYVEALAADLTGLHIEERIDVLPALIRHANTNSDYFSVYTGYPDGVGIFSDGWQPNYNEWMANERAWYKGAAANPDSVYVTEPYQDAATGSFCLTYAKAFAHDPQNTGVVAIDLFADVLTDVVNKAVVGKDSYAFLTDAQGNIFVHFNPQYAPVVDENEDTVFQNIGVIEDRHYIDLLSKEVIGGETVKLRSADGVMRYYTARIVESTGWILYTALPVSVVNAPIYRQIIAAVIIFVAVLALAIAITYITMKKLIITPIKDVTEAASRLALGDTGVSLSGKYVGELELLANSFRDMESFNTQQTDWLEHIAGGDLSIDVSPRSDKDRIGQTIAEMLRSLNEMFTRIIISTGQVAAGSKQVADGAQSLAQGSTEQAAAIDDLSGSIGQIADKTQQNTDIAREAARLSDSIKESAEKGNSQMEQMMVAVREINEAGNSISKVIKTVDDIAFQTNILALNAAVEAARAGQHGKGFAVVAEEVRNLAAKSAEAASNTGELIENTIAKANLGYSIANETAVSLKEIVDGINRNAEIMDRISLSSEEQSTSIKHINSSIDQVAQVAQQNSATAQESSAASQEMSSQSQVLEDMLSQFKLKGSGRLGGASRTMSLPDRW